MNSRITTIVLAMLALVLMVGVVLYSYEEPRTLDAGPLTVETQEIVTWVDAEGTVINQHDGARIVFHLATDGSLAIEEFIPDRDGKVRRGRRLKFANGYELFLDDKVGTRNSTVKSNAVMRREQATRRLDERCFRDGMEETTRTESGLVIVRTPRTGRPGYFDRAPALGCEVVGHESRFPGRSGAEQIVTRRVVRVAPTVSDSVFRLDANDYVERSPEEHWRLELRDRGFSEEAVSEMLDHPGIQATQQKYDRRHTNDDLRPDWAEGRCCSE